MIIITGKTQNNSKGISNLSNKSATITQSNTDNSPVKAKGGGVLPPWLSIFTDYLGSVQEKLPEKKTLKPEVIFSSRDKALYLLLD